MPIICILPGGLKFLPVKSVANNILAANIKDINFQYKIYSDLGHMDISTITFTKALQEFYKQDK